MSGFSYLPPKGSLAYDVCAFFLANPDEELNRSDVMLKFKGHITAPQTALASAVIYGLLIKSGNTYRAGPKLNAVMHVAMHQAAPAEHPTPPKRLNDATPDEWTQAARAVVPPKLKRPRVSRSDLTPPPADSLTITQAPIIGAVSRKGDSKWTEILTKIASHPIPPYPTGLLPTVTLDKAFLGALKKATEIWNKTHPRGSAGRLRCVQRDDQTVVQRVS